MGYACNFVGFNIVKISNCLWSLRIKLIPHCSPRKNNIDYRIGKIYFIYSANGKAVN